MRRRACVCAPDCGDNVCGDDGCGGSCGDCQASETCDAGACVCAPVCGDNVCGDDGCGGSCGDCQASETCDAGACVCAPSCSDKGCGDDGCGGSCGDCAEGLSCSEGACILDSPSLSIISISPASVAVGEQADVSISGTGFEAGLTVRLGATSLGVREVTGSQLITAMIPGDLEVGSYDVIVVNPDDTVASLPSGFEVRAAEEPQALSCGDGLCSDGEDCEVCPTDCGVCQEVERPSSGGVLRAARGRTSGRCLACSLGCGRGDSSRWLPSVEGA